MPHDWSLLNGNLIVDNSAALMDGSGGYHGPVRWTYVHLQSGVMIDPHVGFYRNPPPNAKCRWSTNNGEKEPHHFNKNLLEMPSRQLWLWNDTKLKTVADQYKQKFWRDLKSLTRPNTFFDLYEYFDSATLWYSGAYNLWNLINMLVTETHQRWPAVLDHWKKETDDWVHSLLYEWKGFKYNQNALKKWDGRSDPVIDVRFNEMFNVGLDELGPQEVAILRDALIANFYHLTGQVPYLPPPTYPYYPRPFDNVTTAPIRLADTSSKATSSKAVVIVSSDAQECPTSKSPAPEIEAENTNDEQDTPQKPSPPASLASIPEEADAEAGPHSHAEKLPLEAENTQGTAAETAIPEITTEPAPVPTDSSAHGRKDSNASTDALFFNPSPMRLQVSGRHMSVQSAPDEESEPMIGTAAKTSLAESHQHASMANSSSSSTSRGKVKKGPWRLQHKSPPRNNSCPPFNPTGATPPRNMHIGLPPYLPFGTSSNMPPNPCLMSGLSGMPPAPPSGFIPFGTPRPHGVGIGHPMGPEMPFHSQLPPQHIPMGQQNFNQGPPPQPVGFQNTHPPFQQSGVQDYQARLNNNGGHMASQKSTRRNSTISNGSRKVRDDPVHGAIYSLREPGPRKNSSSSSGRRPSFTKVHCNNADLQFREFSQLLNHKFRECPCSTCDEATRSIYIKGFVQNLQSSQIQEGLFTYFGYLSPVAVTPKKSCKTALVVFRNDYDAIRAVMDFQNNEDKSIRGLALSADIWYPFFSKHYFLRAEFSRGLSFETNNDRDGTPRRFSQSKVQRDSWRNTPTRHGGELLTAPQQFPSGNVVPFLPMPPPISQRKLWEPQPPTNRREQAANPRKGIMEPTFPSKAEKRRSQTKAETPQKGENRADELRTKEDWRSKPPFEEAIDDDGEYETAAADTVSTHSSQGSRNAKVRLPSPQQAKARIEPEDKTSEQVSSEMAAAGEAQHGNNINESMASSRTMSPEICEEQAHTSTIAGVAAPAMESIAKVIAETEEEGMTEKTESSTKNVSEPQTRNKATGKHQPKKNKNKRGSASQKTILHLPEADNGLAEGASTRGYRKTMTDLSSAVDAVYYPNECGTVVRHKQPRPSILPSYRTETPEPKTEPPVVSAKAASEVFGAERIGEVTALLKDEALINAAIKMMDAAMENPDDEQVKSPVGEPQQPPKKKAKHKNEGKAQGGGTSGRSTPADAQPRGLSPSSSRSTGNNGGPSSRVPSPSMKNHDDSSAPRTGGTQKSKSRKKNIRYKRRKVTDTASDISEGLAKSGGSQAKQNQGARLGGGSPTRTPNFEEQTKSVEATTMAPEAPESDATSQGTSADAQSTYKPNKETYRANNGGSLRMKKNRSPEKIKQPIEDAPPEECDSPTKRRASAMPTIFEPPNNDKKDMLPDVSLFAVQKSYIDELKILGGARKVQSGPPAPSSASEPRSSTGTPRSWSGVVKNEDPFAAVEGKPASTDWIEDSTARIPRVDSGKRANNTSPTPSPEKKTHKHTKNKATLSATAPAFMSSNPTSPVPQKEKMSPSASTFAFSMSPSPAPSAVSGHSAIPVKNTGVDQSTATTKSAAPTVGKKENTPQHKKRPSLPGQPTGVDKRFVTPADQVSDPKKLVQPGAPVREKKAITAAGPRNGHQVTDQNPDHIPVNNPRLVPLAEAEESKSKPALSPPTKTAAEAAAAAASLVIPKDHVEAIHVKKSKGTANSKKVETAKTKTAAELTPSESAPSMNNDNFPTLGEAAATESAGKKKRVTSIVKSSTAPSSAASSSSSSPSGATTGTTSRSGPAATGGDTKKNTSSHGGAGKKHEMLKKNVVAASRQDSTNIDFEPPSTYDVVIVAATREHEKKTQQSDKGEEGGWRVVSSNKKTGTTVRAPSGRGGSGGGWRGGRFSSSSNRGFGSGSSDERKGG